MVTWEWLAHALSRVICWSVLHAVAGATLRSSKATHGAMGNAYSFILIRPGGNV